MAAFTSAWIKAIHGYSMADFRWDGFIVATDNKNHIISTVVLQDNGSWMAPSSAPVEFKMLTGEPFMVVMAFGWYPQRTNAAYAECRGGMKRVGKNV